ncbi:penicillin acylase family protein [Candidatus Hydrogenedentota bacterium]
MLQRASVRFGFLGVLALAITVGACDFLFGPTRHVVDDDVTISRDTWGVPHILASTDEGAMFGLGYACAEDRMFQMEYSRRIIQGRLAEMLGDFQSAKRSAVEDDKKNRYSQTYRHAQTVVGNMEPASRRLLEAYADGVNKYLEDNADNLHHLFAKYEITPEPWKPADSIACWERVSNFFGAGWGSSESKTLHTFESLVEGGMTEEEAAESITGYNAIDEEAAVVLESDFDEKLKAEIEAYAASRGYTKALTRKVAKMGSEQKEPVHFSHGWVVGGTRTTNGAAVLHSDPQTHVRNPSIWHEAHVEGETFNSRGIGFPGAPGFIIGFNENVAWGVTAGGGDRADIFRLKMNPNDATKYSYDGQYRNLEVRQETVKVKGGDDETITVKLSHIGPIVTELMKDVGENEEYALKNVFLAISNRHTIEAAVEMMRASDVYEFGEGLERYISPGVNMFFGDSEGNIGYWSPAKMPLRSRLSPMGANGAQYGTGAAYDWEDIIPNKYMPHVFNPASGTVFSGNHLGVGSWFPLPVGLGYGDSQRSLRLRERLMDTGTFTPEDVLDVHFDDVNPAVRILLKIGYHARSNDVTFTDSTESLLDALETWYADGCHFNTSEPHFAAASFVGRMFRTNTAGTLANSYGGGDGGLCYFLKSMEAKIDENSAYKLSSQENAYIEFSLSSGWNTVVNKYGSNPENWQTPFNADAGYLDISYFSNLEGFPSLDTDYDFISELLAVPNLATIWSQKGQSYSQWVNLGDVETSKAILPAGPTENPDSPHYRSEQEMWEQGELRAAPLDATTVADMATSTATFEYSRVFTN